MKEADLKRCVADYLQFGTNQGRWYADRLNSGEVIVIAGQSRRRVKLCKEGTADFYVLIQPSLVFRRLKPIGHSDDRYCRLIFLELKSEKGKQRPEQVAFQKLIESQGAEYHLIRSIEDLELVLSK